MLWPLPWVWGGQQRRVLLPHLKGQGTGNTDQSQNLTESEPTLSMHPKPYVNEKLWSAPDVTSTELNGTPYAYLIDIVHSALKQAERDVSENPNDLKAGELLGSLQRMLGALESKAHGNAA